MKGKYGTSMTIEHAQKRRYNHECKECEHLKYVGGKTPYKCAANGKARHYSSKVVCKRFEAKGA